MRELAAFAERVGCKIVGTYKETASGVKLDRAERRKILAHMRIALMETRAWG